MFETETVGPCLVRKLKSGEEGGGRGIYAPGQSGQLDFPKGKSYLNRTGILQ